MDLRDLTYFETIAELGHLGQAAEKLNRTQPALSKCIQRLEQSLGAQLFQRDGRRIRLTDAGELLLAKSRQLRVSVRQTEREVRDFANGQVGNVRLGCAASMAEHLLPQVLETLLEGAPALTFKLSIGQDDVLREALKDGHLDAIISPLVANDPGVQAYPVLQDEAVVVACADHPLFTAPLALATLSDYAWILPGPSVTARRWIDNVFVSRQLAPPKVQIETNSISLLPRLIARTRLLSFLAREALTLNSGMSQLREVPLAETTMRRTVAVSVRAQGYLPPATVALVDILRERGGDFWREA